MRACFSQFLFIFFVIVICSCSERKSKVTEPTGKRQVYQTIPYHNPEIIMVTPDYKTFVLGIHEKDFLTSGKVDSVLIIKTLTMLYPSSNDSGMACFDWEGEAFQRLISQDDSNLFEYYLEEYIKSIRIAKRYRPNVRWGYYGIPFREYWHPGEDWRNRNNNLIPLMKEMDFLSPSLYTHFLEQERPGKNEKFILSNMNYFLETSKKLNMPIYPFVWHRIHPRNKKYKNQYIPMAQFSSELNLIVNTEYEGKKVDGIIWWNSGINALNELLIRDEKKDSIRQDFLKRPEQYKIYKKEVERILNGN